MSTTEENKQERTKASYCQDKQGSNEWWLLMDNNPELIEKGNSKRCAQNTNIL